MVATPWGDSKELRERRLPPGRATPAEEVAENQRARIFGAMVASVAESGYTAAAVSEISEISGVSVRSFYNLFPAGKEECFLVVLDQILEGTLTALAGAGEGIEDREEKIAAMYGRFAGMVAAQPATASLALSEAFAGGPEAAKRLERATGSLERLWRTLIEESPEHSGMPAAMIEAQVGALQELARTRIRDGQAATLPDLVPELVSLVASYRPPPERLRLGDRRPAVQADGIASSEISERAIRGFILAVAEEGYTGATIRQISKLGQMGVDTFYATFPDKRSVLLAAIDTSTAQMQAIAMAAYRRSLGWSTGLRAAIAGMLGFLAARPATANLLLTEIYAGGPEALAVRADGLAELRGTLAERTTERPAVPPIAPEAILGGVLALARRQLLRKGAESLPSLAPACTYLALAPYLGVEEATRVANSDGRAKPSAARASALPRIDSKGSNWLVFTTLGARWASAEELADELSRSVVDVAAILASLEESGLVERIVPVDPSKPIEWSNSKKYHLLDGAEWEMLTPEERRSTAEDVCRTIVSHLSQALQRETLGRRIDEHLTSVVVEVDQEGWAEIAEIHRAAFDAIQAAREKSKERMRKEGGEMITGHSMQSLFEMPDDEG